MADSTEIFDMGELKALQEDLGEETQEAVVKTSEDTSKRLDDFTPTIPDLATLKELVKARQPEIDKFKEDQAQTEENTNFTQEETPHNVGTVLNMEGKGNVPFTKFDKSTFRYDYYGQDINLDLRINAHTTNREWMKRGNNPYVIENNSPIMRQILALDSMNWVFIGLSAEKTEKHHVDQNGKGIIVELTGRVHRDRKNQAVLHKYGSKKHPDEPVNRKKWNKDRRFINKQKVKNMEEEEEK